MAPDIYEDVALTVKLLKKEGLPDLSDELRNYTEGASTGTEYFMGAIFGLKKALEEKLSETTRARIVNLKTRLEDVLNK